MKGKICILCGGTGVHDSRECGLCDGSGYDHDYTDEIVCPHCGYKFETSYEDFEGVGEGDEIEEECPSCGKTLLAYQDIEVTYVSRKPLEEGE